MRQLLPFPCDPVDPAALYGDLPSARTRPSVRLNMIASIDGATAVAGVRRPGWPRRPGAVRGTPLSGRCRARGGRNRSRGTLRPVGRSVAVLSRSCQLHWDSPFFAAAVMPPIVVTLRPGSGPRAASVYAAPAPTMKLVVSAGLLDAGRRTISRAKRPSHDPAGCLHRRRDHLAAAGHGQRAGPGPCPGRRRDDHLAGSRHGALAGAGQCIIWTGRSRPARHVPPWQPRPCGLSGYSRT